MASDDKTEKPTAKRRRESRKKGQISRTPELGQWAMVLLLSMFILPLLGHEVRTWKDTFQACFGAIAAPQPALALNLLGSAMRGAFFAIVTLGLIVMLITVAASVAQGGMVFSTHSVKPDFKKLNLLKGFKRVFGPQALWQGVKILLKAAVVGLIGYTSIKSISPLIGGLMPMSTVLAMVQDKALGLLRTVAAAGLVLAAADYMVTRFRTEKGLKMTKQEVKDEYKQSEGDPHVKGQIRSRQRAMARDRMISEVGEADVLLVNPTHVAIALKYDPEMGAPRVIARGAGAVAAKIRAAAAAAEVPLVQDVPLARALYRSCEVGQEIPRELFAAVAQVLAFVIARRGRGHTGGEHATPRLTADALPDVPLAARRRRRDPQQSPGPTESPAEQLLDDE